MELQRLMVIAVTHDISDRQMKCIVPPGEDCLSLNVHRKAMEHSTFGSI